MIYIAIFIILLIFSAFFSGTETAYFNIRQHRDETPERVKSILNHPRRLLVSPFEAGDLVVFDMFTMHGSLDNHSPEGRVRLSCDVRWQPVSDPVDPRYKGEDPPGTTGAGYGELNGAKPLDVDWHIR